MNKGKMVLTQMQSLISRYHFEKSVKEYNSDKNVRSFSTWNLLQVMLLSHCTGKKSLRDICGSFKSVPHKLYHIGIQGVSRNNLSNSLAKRDAAVFEKLFYTLLGKVHNEIRQKNDKRFKFKNDLIAIDSTTISLCLSLCEWASFRSTKGGVKIHTMFDIKKQMPDFIIITEARKHDNTAIPDMPFRKGALYVLDRGYLCLKTLENINKTGAFFVTRLKSNTQYKVISKNKPKTSTILKDRLIVFTGVKSNEYSGVSRLVRYKNPEDGKVYDFITNNLHLSAETIASIYKSRWDIELFFKWVKQNLKVKSFIGTSRNAVLIQIWTAAIAFLLMAYMRFLSKTTKSLTEVFRYIGSHIFSEQPYVDLLNDTFRATKKRFKNFEIQLDLGL